MRIPRPEAPRRGRFLHTGLAANTIRPREALETPVELFRNFSFCRTKVRQQALCGGESHFFKKVKFFLTILWNTRYSLYEVVYIMFFVKNIFLWRKK
jgi:hypothetical protein